MADEREQQWRTGRHPADEPGPRQRTIYGPDGELRGVMFTTEAARLVVESLNGLAAAREENAKLTELAADYGGPRGLSPNEVRAELAATREQLEQSAGHTAEECEADAIQTEAEKLERDLGAAREENVGGEGGDADR